MGFFPKSRSRIRREASDWVVLLAGNPLEEDRAAFARWHGADPRHAEAYQRIASIWDRSSELAPARPANDAGIRPRERPRAFGLALAASLAAVIFVSLVLLGSRWLPGPAVRDDPMLLAAAVGEIREIGLPDGSRLTLDSASRVEAAFSKAERRLTLLKGRARFRVAHETRPFLVRAGSSEIVATGTLFDVSLIGGHTSVLLLEGSVEVRARHNRQRIEHLTPGQKLVLVDTAPAKRQQATIDDAAWPTHMLEFDDTRLDEAVGLANRYSKVQLKLGDDRVRGMRISGAFRAGDNVGFARSLVRAFELGMVSQPDGTILLVGSKGDAQAP